VTFENGQPRDGLSWSRRYRPVSSLQGHKVNRPIDADSHYVQDQSSSTKHGDIIMLKRRHFLGAGLGSVLIPTPTLAVAQAQTPKAGSSGQVGRGNVPLLGTSAAERMNELGPENAAMAAYAGSWDVTETVWDKPGGNTVTTTGLVAERRTTGSYLQEFIRPALDTSNQDIKRIDYLSFQRVEGRWKYVSIEMRAPVGIMPAYSFEATLRAWCSSTSRSRSRVAGPTWRGRCCA
jgi:hypothetical protein